MLDSQGRQTDNADAPAQRSTLLPMAETVRIDLTTGVASTHTDATPNGSRHATPDPGSAPSPLSVVADVWAVVPCYNRPRDVQLLLQDVASLELGFEMRAPLQQRETGVLLDPARSNGVQGHPQHHTRQHVVINLRLIVVDNASDTPLSTIPTPPNLSVEHLRLGENTGGSGGFNAGLSRVMTIAADDHQQPGHPVTSNRFVWLLDSDARVLPGTLRELVRVLLARPDAAAVGSALADVATGCIFEVGGMVNPRHGRLVPKATGLAGVPATVQCDYVAACSALVRAEAARATGLFPDVFLNCDEVEWFLRMSRATGLAILASPKSIALHPAPTFRFSTVARYYAARNCLGPPRALSMPARIRFRCAMHEVWRAMVQEFNLGPKFARMHLAGLADASKPVVSGKAPPEKTSFDPFQPLETLAQQLVSGSPRTITRVSVQQILLDKLLSDERIRLVDQIAVVLAQSPGAGMKVDHARGNNPRTLAKACIRWLTGPREQIAVVHASAGCTAWFAGRTIVQVVPGAGYMLRKAGPAARLTAACRGLGAFVKGTLLAYRATRYPGERVPLPALPSAHCGAGVSPARCERAPSSVLPSPGHAAHETPPRHASQPSHARASSVSQLARRHTSLTLAIVVLSFNRRETLRRTLATLAQLPEAGQAQVIVVDNASTDGSAAMVAAEFPAVSLIRLDTNIGVAALNAGVHAATSDVVFVLDDDARPESGVVGAAMELLSSRPDLAAVTLHPVHPATRTSEWPFAASLAGRPDDRWPVMGCGNLVRRDAWLRAGGYEPSYFLYRNDTDLALKLLATRRDTTANAPQTVRASEPGGATHTFGVHFDPHWIVWHESQGIASKSPKWHRLATRNWIWTARRHGRGASKLLGVLLGVLWSHKLAGLRPRCHWASLKGAAAGLFTKPPGLAPGIVPTGRDFGRLFRLQLGRFRNKR